MKLFCSALASGKHIPAKYANKGIPGGQNISLPLTWSGVPQGTKSFALSMVDQHPLAKGCVHWAVINMSANAREIAEDASGRPRRLPPGSIELRNGFGKTGYGGPQLPRGSSPHEYLIMLYALDAEELQFGPLSHFTQFQTEVPPKALDFSSLVAWFAP